MSERLTDDERQEWTREFIRRSRAEREKELAAERVRDAAPELLEALEFLVLNLEEDGLDGVTGLGTARAAIKKARGE